LLLFVLLPHGHPSVDTMTTNTWDDDNCHAWSQSETDELVAKLITGSIIGIVLGLIMTLLASLPLCCGVMKAQGKIIAMIGIPVGILCCFMPLFLSLGGCSSFVETLCENCPVNGDESKSSCDEPEMQGSTRTYRDVISDACHALGILIVYFGGYGWAAVILGIVAASLSCCILCGCCKMKEEGSYVDGGNQTSA